LKVKTDYHKIDEIPFDFQRRCMSVIVEDNQNQHLLICKGAVEEIMRLSLRMEVEGQVLDVEPAHDAYRKQLGQELNEQGFRVVAVAYKTVEFDRFSADFYATSMRLRAAGRLASCATSHPAA
jgi:P-type Mg2+ transporter